MRHKPFPTLLAFVNLSPTLTDIGWDNITRAILCTLKTNECLEVLKRAPVLEYCPAVPLDGATVNLDTTTHHSRLRSLDLASRKTEFLEMINVPSFEEWIQNTDGYPLPMTAMLSLLKRSRCCLKILNLQHISALPKNLSILFQEMPSLECLQLHFWYVNNADGLMDDILMESRSTMLSSRCQTVCIR